MTRWVDSHCHLRARDAARDTVEDANAAGVAAMVNVGTDTASSVEAIATAHMYEGVWATAGVHPHDATEGIEAIPALLGDPLVVAVGECGLDYHYDHSPRDTQRAAFAAQIDLAHERDLPLVIHTREAWPDTFQILAAHGMPRRTIFHCFTGGLAEAERCWEMGATLSFSGIVTFPTAGELADVATRCPLEQMLVETDSPYLAPVPHRGRRNQPAYVTHVAERIAALRSATVAEIAETTWQNTVIAFSVADS